MKLACLRQRTLAKSSQNSSFRPARLWAVGFATFVVVSVMLAAVPLRAASYSWAVSAGDWSVASNWGGSLLPTSSGTAYVVNGGTVNVTQLGETCGTLSLGNSAGSGSVQMTAGSLSANAQYVGDSGAGAFTQTGGTISLGAFSNVYIGSLYLGNSSGASGVYSLGGSGQLWAGAENVGYSGSGSFVQSGGTNSGGIYLGTNVGSLGVYNLTGGQVSASSFEYIGQSGTGVFIQTGGINGSNSLAVGNNLQSSGTYSLGGGFVFGASETVGGASNGAFNQWGGTNGIGTLYLGSGSASVGIYNLSGSGLMTYRGTPEQLYLGYSGSGTFNQSGGTNDFSSDGELYLGWSGTGIYNLSSGLLTGGGFGGGGEYVGYGGTGTFNQSGGTNTTYGGVSLGGSSGTYNLTGGLLVISSLTQGSGLAAFNFSGGTLQAGRSFSASVPLTLGTSGGGATFDTAGFAVTLSGSLSGLGSLIKVDSGTLILAATDTYSGNTLVRSGTLALGSPLALQDSTFDTSGSGTLSFGSLTAATLGGLTGPGKLALSNSASSAVALSVGNNNVNTTYAGAMIGSGSLTKVGSGALLLSGSNTFTGPTTTTQGKLTVDGWLPNSPVSVNGGTLGGTGYLGSGTVNAGGTLAPGNPLGVLHLSGNLVLATGAAMDFDLDGVSTDDEVSMPSGSLTTRHHAGRPGRRHQPYRPHRHLLHHLHRAVQPGAAVHLDRPHLRRPGRLEHRHHLAGDGVGQLRRPGSAEPRRALRARRGIHAGSDRPVGQLVGRRGAG